MISCIIPAYNEEKRIKDVIEAIKNSKLIDEIIVVSDGSTDNTYEMAKNVILIKL
ncbi:MAG: glycosyltransferase family 2 protein [Minisyncoccia bacterium]